MQKSRTLCNPTKSFLCRVSAGIVVDKNAANVIIELNAAHGVTLEFNSKEILKFPISGKFLCRI